MGEHSWIWVLVSIFFVVVLGFGIAYGSGKWRQFRRHPELQAERDAATRANFDATGRRSQG
jgi:ABC-type transporter Mla subunit MlaD